MTKDEARKELLETLEEYCHDKGYGLQTFAGLSDLVYTLYPLKKTMTNADKIRSMSNEELADWLLKIFGDNELYCEACVFCYDCECVSPPGYACRDAALEWLKQEHKENSNEL